MNSLTVEQMAALSRGRLLQGRTDVEVCAVETDTRKLSSGCLFVALVGDRYDGHDYVAEARDKGAVAVMVSRPVAVEGIAVILVADTLTGLQCLSAAYRQTLDLRVIAITGSNGKTSTKDMVRAVLSRKGSVTATQGNFNNHIGLPLSVLRASSEHQYAVWEIGMNHAGEIAPLAEIARPDIAIITNIGVAHIGFLGSREAIAQEKGMLAEALNDDGVLILNGADDFASVLAKRTSAKIMRVGIESGDIYASEIQEGARGTHFKLHCYGEVTEAFLPVPGHHMLTNALLAVAAGHVCGISLEVMSRGLAEVELTPGRMQHLEVGGIQVVNDAYNANPDSMVASLKTVGSWTIEGKRYAILGAMGELGEESERAHHEVGCFAMDCDFDYICSVGDGAKGLTELLQSTPRKEAIHFAKQEDAAAFLRNNARPGDLILLKGSLSAAMGKVLENFMTEHA